MHSPSSRLYEHEEIDGATGACSLFTCLGSSELQDKNMMVSRVSDNKSFIELSLKNL